MRNLKIAIGVAGVVLAATALLSRKRKDGTTLIDDLQDVAEMIGNRIIEFGTSIKDRLLHHVKGPNGEDVFLDMYDRQFYQNTEGKRVYLDEEDALLD